MERSYNIDIAINVGGVEKAVVLSALLSFCSDEKKKNPDKQDNECWVRAGTDVWQKKIPEVKNIGRIFRDLEDDGWLLSKISNDNPFDHTKWIAPSKKTISLFARYMKDEATQPQKPKPISKQSIDEIMREYGDVIDGLYRLYPTSTYRGERGKTSTGKCSKDKARIASLLRRHSPEAIKASIEKYVEEMGGKYLKNFSTFLNNLPEYDEDNPAEPLSQEEQLRAMGYQG